jgi:hypothetical protein
LRGAIRRRSQRVNDAIRKVAWEFLAVAIALLATCPVPAEEPATEPKLHEKWQRAYRRVAESIEMRRGETELSIHPAALLYYTNPVRTNEQHGAVFLWTLEGRPAVFASIWSALHRQQPGSRNVTHEWHSLLESSDVTARRSDKLLWTSDEPGIVWQSLAGLPVPAATRSARLIQMRGIVRRLSVGIETSEESELRLMSQPLFRYAEKTPGAIDGAVFAFGMATDPELLVLLEANSAAEKPAWKIAFARFGNQSMTVKDGEQTIWSCEKGIARQPTGKYYLMWRAEEMPADPPAEEQK